MLLFEETAEELVNRLFDEWLKEKTFIISFPLTDPVLKDCVIRSLKITDKTYQRIIFKENLNFSCNSDLRKYVQLHRENDVLLKVAQIFAKGAGVFPRPPKPTHRQHQSKTCHLRLVSNM